MTFNRLLILVIGAMLLAAPAFAHGPNFHQAKLVHFAKPVPAPGFTLDKPEGGTLSLSDFQGKYVLLNFWATWCPPCVREMPTMERLARRFAKRPFAVLAVSLDAEGAGKVKPFIKRLGVTFPIALDPQSRVAEQYGARDLPVTFLIDPEGRVVMAAKGEREWDSAEISSYLEELLDAAG